MNFICHFEKCKERGFETRRGLSTHIRHSHKGTSQEKYAEKFHTDEWVTCIVCGFQYYLPDKYHKNYWNVCGKCKQEYRREVRRQDPNFWKNVRKQQFDTMRKEGTLEQRSQKRKDTLKINGTDIIANKKKSLDHQLYPEKYSKAAQKWIKERKEEDPDYFSRKSIESNKKVDQTKRVPKWKKTCKENDSMQKAAEARRITLENTDGYNRIGETLSNTLNSRTKEEVDDWVCKVHDAKKRNGTNRKISKAEIAFSWLLDLVFGEVPKHWQVKVKTKECDNIYGQTFQSFPGRFTCDFVLTLKYSFVLPFDGLYFHGLKKEMNQTRDTPQKEGILGTIKRDVAFEKYCQQNNINLIRFNDANFDKWLLGKEDLIPHFVCGKSEQIDFLFEKLNQYFEEHNLRKIK